MSDDPPERYLDDLFDDLPPLTEHQMRVIDTLRRFARRRGIIHLIPAQDRETSVRMPE